MNLTTPVTLELKRQEAGGLSDSDIKEVRKGLLREAGCLSLMKQLEEKGEAAMTSEDSVKDMKMSESAVAFFKTIYYGELPEIMTSDDPQYAPLRKICRATLSKVFVNSAANEHFSVRDWFTSRGIQPRPDYTCSLVSNSDLLLGQVRFSCFTRPQKHQNILIRPDTVSVLFCLVLGSERGSRRDCSLQGRQGGEGEEEGNEERFEGQLDPDDEPHQGALDVRE